MTEQQLFAALYIDEDIVICPQFSKHQFGELLRLVLSLLNRTAAGDLINTVCYLTAYR
jgi:hypothetical protein